MLDRLLKELYQEAISNLDEDQMDSLEKYLTRNFGSKQSAHWTLGEYIQVIFDNDLLKLLERAYDGKTKYVHRSMIEHLVDYRNRAMHADRKQLSSDELDEFMHEVAGLTRKFKRIPSKDPGVRCDPYTVNDLHAASDYFDNLIEHLIRTTKRNSLVSITVIGISMYQAWDIIEHKFLRKFNESKKPIKVRVGIKMLDHEWNRIPAFNSRWKDQCEQNEARIRERVKKIQYGPLSVALYKYRAFPAIHGFLINNEYLVASLTSFNDNELTDAFADYFITCCSNDSLVQYLFKHFRHWSDQFENKEVLRESSE